MQGDGNLVLYHEGKALWNTEPQGRGSWLAMQPDGNLVMYSSEGHPEWASSTNEFEGAYLVLQDDSNAVIYQDGHAIWDWESGYWGDHLAAGERLEPGAYLLSADHRYKLIMQGDGNLVLYHEGKALWNTEPQGGWSWLAMQPDGNLVMYSSEGHPEWASSTNEFEGAYLVLQDDSNAVIYQDGHAIWDWESEYQGDRLYGGQQLEPGAYLLSADHQYKLIMQGDGNLVLYHEGDALWASNTVGEPGSYAIMQADGNFVVYRPHQGPWSTETSGHPGSYVVAQDDGNLVVYEGAMALWDRIDGRIGPGGGEGTTGEKILDEASKWTGRPYCWDGGEPNGPNLGTPDPEEGPDHGLFCGINGYDHSEVPGFDCTGLTLYAIYQVTGKVLSHSPSQASDAISQGGQRIYHQSELQPGDLVYFGSSFGDITHAGVYAGLAKEGQPSFVSAVTEYVGVTVETMAWEEYGEPFVGGVRF